MLQVMFDRDIIHNSPKIDNVLFGKRDLRKGVPAHAFHLGPVQTSLFCPFEIFSHCAVRYPQTCPNLSGAQS